MSAGSPVLPGESVGPFLVATTDSQRPVSGISHSLVLRVCSIGRHTTPVNRIPGGFRGHHTQFRFTLRGSPHSEFGIACPIRGDRLQDDGPDMSGPYQYPPHPTGTRHRAPTVEPPWPTTVGPFTNRHDIRATPTPLRARSAADENQVTGAHHTHTPAAATPRTRPGTGRSEHSRHSAACESDRPCAQALSGEGGTGTSPTEARVPRERPERPRQSRGCR